MNKMLAGLLGQVYREGEGGAGAGGGGAGGAPPPVVVPPAQGTQGSGAQPAWYDGFKDPEVKTWLTAYKGAYPDPESVAAKAYNLEKFVGVEKAGRGVVIPKDDDAPEVKQAFWKKVFNPPEKPDGYTLPKEAKAEVVAAVKDDPTFGKFRELAHKMNMPASMFGEVMNFFIEQSAGHNATQQAEFEQREQAGLEKLAQEWPGQEYDKNVELGRRAAKTFIPHANKEELEATLLKVEGALGSAFTLKFMASIGKAMGEHNFVGGSGDGDMGNGGVTPEAARLRISELTKDKEFGKKLVAGDVTARREWDNLHEVGYGQVKSVQ